MFRETPSSVQVRAGSDVFLKCIVSNQQGKAQWTKDGFALDLPTQNFSRNPFLHLSHSQTLPPSLPHHPHSQTLPPHHPILKPCLHLFPTIPILKPCLPTIPFSNPASPPSHSQTLPPHHPILKPCLHPFPTIPILKPCLPTIPILKPCLPTIPFSNPASIPSPPSFTFFQTQSFIWPHHYLLTPSLPPLSSMEHLATLVFTFSGRSLPGFFGAPVHVMEPEGGHKRDSN
ncbi:hypothetical protein Pmani_023694 [Petrolisthes manimaculis]|uniref:Ig-like domain-containing protein n=1 Tax=Petrolisthes manimaculis TaxID=1843537 RepID=A0AAE1PAM1_9EUCA|nr:hypothetical protein Pmani_023694 [Petrolisthes manimaculis]